jgi:hypothetical protein
MTRRLILMLALAAAASTQATAGSAPPRQNDGGCPSGYHRGVGGSCVLNPDAGPYKPDPHWTPCDYSQGPQVPEGCGN